MRQSAFVKSNSATRDDRSAPKPCVCLALPDLTPFEAVAFTVLRKRKKKKNTQQQQHSSLLPRRDCHEVDSTPTARAFLCSSRVHGHCSVAASAHSLFGWATTCTHTHNLSGYVVINDITLRGKKVQTATNETGNLRIRCTDDEMTDHSVVQTAPQCQIRGYSQWQDKNLAHLTAAMQPLVKTPDKTPDTKKTPATSTHHKSK